jgi:outer membrane protein OmpA-like peptidoglycan-associated protein
MKRKLFIVLLLISIQRRVDSQNLLLNGGFEEENICTEFKVNCAPEAWISSSDGFSNYFKDASRAYEGEHCLAIEAGNARAPFRRTFFRTQLVCGLKKGNKYRIELHVKSPHTILDSIGINFSNDDPLITRRPLQYIQPSLLFTQQGKTFLKDSSWQQVVLEYTATGNEVYMAIGNFSKKDITGPTGISLENHFFVFLDDISMVALNENERLCDNWQTVMQDLYDRDERHEFLKITLRRQAARPPVVLKPATILTVDTLVFPDVLFASGKKELQPSSYHLLDSFCINMGGKIIDSLVIEGHTDNTGTVEFNRQLSLGRAEAVAAYLRRCRWLVSPVIITRGWGSRRPVSDNKIPQGRQQNRRVEMLFYIRE